MPFRFTQSAQMVIASCLIWLCGVPVNSEERFPLPSSSEQAKSRQLIEQAYGVISVDDDEEKQLLAQKLFQAASDASEETANRYMLLRLAGTLALDAGNADLSLAAATTLSRQFEIDDPLTMEIAVLRKLAARTTSEEQRRVTLGALQKVLEQLIDEDKYETANRLAPSLTQVAEALKDEPEVQRAQDLVREIKLLAAAYSEVTAAFTELAANPQSANANLLVGKFLCFHKDDWNRGLPLLAKGSDQALKDAAIQQLDQEGTPKVMEKLADFWWDFAARNQGLPKRNIRSFAARLYGDVLPSLTSLSQARINRRLAEFEMEPVDDEVNGEALKSTSAYMGRFGQRRRRMLKEFGGTPETEEAVSASLKWIAKQQKTDGSWSLMGPYSDGGAEDNAAAATAMALMALQGHGNTHNLGVFKQHVMNGWRFLLKNQNAGGSFANQGPTHQRLYAQAQCSIAICEIYGMTGDQRFKRPAELAIKYALQAQDKKLGGWRYVAGEDSDTSVTGWYVMALSSAHFAKLDVPQVALDNINQFLDRVAVDGGKAYNYTIGSFSTPSTSAAGLLCRQYLGWKQDDSRLVDGVSILKNKPIDYSEAERDVYYWYYATQALSLPTFLALGDQVAVEHELEFRPATP